MRFVRLTHKTMINRYTLGFWGSLIVSQIAKSEVVAFVWISIAVIYFFADIVCWINKESKGN